MACPIELTRALKVTVRFQHVWCHCLLNCLLQSDLFMMTPGCSIIVSLRSFSQRFDLVVEQGSVRRSTNHGVIQSNPHSLSFPRWIAVHVGSSGSLFHSVATLYEKDIQAWVLRSHCSRYDFQPFFVETWYKSLLSKLIRLWLSHSTALNGKT